MAHSRTLLSDSISFMTSSLFLGFIFILISVSLRMNLSILCSGHLNFSLDILTVSMIISSDVISIIVLFHFSKPHPESFQVCS